ncbi:MAG: hypothetical protein ISS57_00815 [Anaerolineales bacterium]|nr:hypothetical protein [Anaerolineales bacterium]
MNRKLSLIFVLLLVIGVACSSPEAAVEESQAPAAEEMAGEDAEDSHSEDADEAEESHAEEAEDADDADDADEADEAEDHEDDDMSEESREYDTEFPLPDDVQNFTGGGDQVNFATSLTVEEAIEFYRGALTEMGLIERTLNTAITETTFSMVFDGHESGEAIVVQGVDLGNGTTNINIRFEDV